MNDDNVYWVYLQLMAFGILSFLSIPFLIILLCAPGYRRWGYAILLAILVGGLFFALVPMEVTPM